jgi:hypothetical protein
MTTDNNEYVAKNSIVYNCKYCDYNTSKKTNYSKHHDTLKHKNNENNAKNNEFVAKSSKSYTCEICFKHFNDRAGLWRHKKKCINTNKTKDEPTDKELVMMLLKQNSELIKEQSDIKQIIFEIVKQGTNNNTTNITHTNSHNKAFNLNFFLNETCKNAMNITEFVDSINLQISDLEKVGEIGYVEGISNIIIKNLNALDETKRPLHCTDKKRETIYIKDEGQWEKDDDNKSKFKKTINKINSK